MIQNPDQKTEVRAVAYYRHSSQDREDSISRQQEEVRQFADEHDLEIIKEFIDSGETGRITEEGNDFNDLMESSIKERIDLHYVLCVDPSRWRRFLVLMRQILCRLPAGSSRRLSCKQRQPRQV